MSKINLIDKLSIILILIGSLNWGLVGLLKLDLVSAAFGASTLLSRLIYILVGLSAINFIYFLFRTIMPKR